MFKSKKLLSLFLFLLSFYPFLFADETLTITTYYPSPYGSYNELQANRVSVGDTNADSQMTSADLPPANGQIYAARSVIYKPQNGPPASNAVTGELVYNTNDSSYYYYDGSSWAKLGGGWYVPTDVKATTATHNGNFGSYQAMYTWIQSNGCSGYHVCTANDLASYLQLHTLSSSIGGWYNTAHDTYSSTVGSWWRDCESWSSAGSFGPVWMSGMANANWCSTLYPVMCCK